MGFDFLIQGGFILDGTGGNSVTRVMDIGIQGDRIKAVGNLSGVTADKFINASGLCVSPGFIDTHSHSEFTLLADGRAQGKIFQGVTTEINGNCGLSAAPLYGMALEQRIKDFEELQIRERWNNFAEYFALLNKRKCAINFMTLVGHGNLRSSVGGLSDRELTHEEKEKMLHFLRDALESGARGLSTGLVYPPGIYANTLEIVELAQETARYDKCIYTTHMRNEGDKLLDAIDEVIKIGLDSGIHVHISHLKTSGEKNWEKINKVFEKINNAQSAGLSVTCDRYPYIVAATDLDAVLPAWAYEGGHEEELKRLQTVQERLYEDILISYPDETCWENIMISTVQLSKNKWMEGKTLSAIGKSLKKMPIECLFEILIEEKLRVGALFFFMNEDNLRSILKVPYSMIGSDSSVRCFDGITAQGQPHPRGFGCFPKMLGTYVRDQKVLSLKEAVYKMTGLPAQTFGIKQRGIIADGFFADVTIFDSDRIKDNSTFDNPFEKPEGINYVFVNGTPVLWEGMETGKLPGRILV
ncbi:MAG: D-aminoacylase [Thermodesulfovibrionia bacterium]|nr:D-aminoacylase [Thermodesulfovibrionia bacterium]